MLEYTTGKGIKGFQTPIGSPAVADNRMQRKKGIDILLLLTTELILDKNDSEEMSIFFF